MIDFILFTAIVGFFVVVGVALASPYFSFGLLALCFLMSASFLGLGYLIGSDETGKYGLFSNYFPALHNMIDERIKFYHQKNK